MLNFQMELVLAPIFNKCSALADVGDRLATIDMGRKGGIMPLSGVGLGPHLTQWPGPRPTCVPSGILILAAVWPQRTWAQNWGLCPFGWGSWVPV